MPHIPNVTPVGGLATWSGVRLSKTWSYGLIIAAMVISDLFLGVHKTMPYVYASLLLATWLAQQVKHVTIAKVGGVVLLNAVLFFLITNFGVWQTTPQAYPHTLAGLMASYTAAVPFFRASLLGDIAYTAVFFGLDYAVLRLTQKQVTLAKSV